MRTLRLALIAVLLGVPATRVGALERTIYVAAPERPVVRGVTIEQAPADAGWLADWRRDARASEPAAGR
jgi:hypothetical protein